MTIEYSLTKYEIVQGFFRGLRSSPKFLGVILVWDIVVTILISLSIGALSHPLNLKGAFTVFAIAIGFLIFLPVWLFIRGKTSKRSLTISQVGIRTQIGPKLGQIPWAKVKTIVSSPEHVLVANRGGNAFFIPNRAFSEPGDKIRFVEQMIAWKNVGP